MAKVFLLKNNKKSLFTFAGVIRSKEELDALELQAKEVDPTKKKSVISREDHQRHLSMQKNVRLMPGINEITDEELAALEKHPEWNKSFEMIKIRQPRDAKGQNFRLEKPFLSWVQGFSPKNKEMLSFKDLSFTEAFEIIENMWDQDLIIKYKEIAKNPEVKAALQTQLEKLTIPKSKGAEGNDRPYALAS